MKLTAYQLYMRLAALHHKKITHIVLKMSVPDKFQICLTANPFKPSEFFCLYPFHHVYNYCIFQVLAILSAY